MDQTALVAIARTIHEAIRGWVAAHGETPLEPWPSASEWTKRSTMESILWRIENPDAPHAAQHEQWLEQLRRDGWVFGETKDFDRKTHPMMIPYEELPEFEKRKDAIFNALALSLSEPI